MLPTHGCSLFTWLRRESLFYPFIFILGFKDEYEGWVGASGILCTSVLQDLSHVQQLPCLESTGQGYQDGGD